MMIRLPQICSDNIKRKKRALWAKALRLDLEPEARTLVALENAARNAGEFIAGQVFGGIHDIDTTVEAYFHEHVPGYRTAEDLVERNGQCGDRVRNLGLAARNGAGHVVASAAFKQATNAYISRFHQGRKDLAPLGIFDDLQLEKIEEVMRTCYGTLLELLPVVTMANDFSERARAHIIGTALVKGACADMESSFQTVDDLLTGGMRIARLAHYARF